MVSGLDDRGSGVEISCKQYLTVPEVKGLQHQQDRKQHDHCHCDCD